MLGYLVNAKWGAASYNLVHTYAGPVLLLLLSLALPASQLDAVRVDLDGALGFDRMLGFGLKYPTLFQGHPPATRLNAFGRPVAPGCTQPGNLYNRDARKE